MTHILFVCMGNICRSPIAQVVAQHLAAGNTQKNVGLLGRLTGQSRSTVGAYRFDSAGTHAQQHAGEPPDPRSVDALKKRGYTVGKMRARKVVAQDFSEFDLIVAMDADNVRALELICPAAQQHKIKRLLDFLPVAGSAAGASPHSTAQSADKDVPDPYYGNQAGFEHVLDLCEAGVRGLLAAITQGKAGIKSAT